MKTVKIFTNKKKIYSYIEDLFKKYYGIDSLVKYYKPSKYGVILSDNITTEDNGRTLVLNDIAEHYEVIYHEDTNTLELNSL